MNSDTAGEEGVDVDFRIQQVTSSGLCSYWERRKESGAVGVGAVDRVVSSITLYRGGEL